MGNKNKNNTAARSSSSKVGKGEQIVKVRPSEIYFTFTKILNTFSGCGKTLSETLRELKDGEVVIGQIPMIAIIEADKPTRTEKLLNDSSGECTSDHDDDDGYDDNEKKKKHISCRAKAKQENLREKIYCSMNNRRLWVFKELEKLGKIEEIECRLQSKEVGLRLERKGSRNFRIDRVSLEAKISIFTDKDAAQVKAVAENTSNSDNQ